MGKKRNKQAQVAGKPGHMLFGRKTKRKDFDLFCHTFRDPNCLYLHSWNLLEINKLNPQKIRSILAFNCSTIEHQITTLRKLTQLTQQDYKRRLLFTRNFLNCLKSHHNVLYEGILFGSTVNGLGFRDSDVDLRLRPLKRIGINQYEPYALDEDLVDKTLRNIAYATTRCSPAIGEYVPSTRCPVAKLTFVREKNMTEFRKYPQNLNNLEEGLKYDISLGSETPLGTFNSMFLRFLCNLEPKFHLLATILRYWSSVHELIVPGYLSSYALINMLIYFCQTTQPPLLPTLDQMRDLYFEGKKNQQQKNACKQDNSERTSIDNSQKSNENSEDLQQAACLKGLTQIEWHCIVCLDKKYYKPSKNNQPLSVLLLKFFELYLNFPYTTHILTTRPGRPLSLDEFTQSTQFHPRFPINPYLTIQDPFDLKHNLTAGMQGGHLFFMLSTIRQSYELLFNELMNNFFQPNFSPDEVAKYEDLDNDANKKKQNINEQDKRSWGLNVLFSKFKQEHQGSAQINQKKSPQKENLKQGKHQPVNPQSNGDLETKSSS